MSDTRKGSASPRHGYRRSRFFIEQGKWFFDTREGRKMGPFDRIDEAEARLEAYLLDVNSVLKRVSVVPELQPIDLRWR